MTTSNVSDIIQSLQSNGFKAQSEVLVLQQQQGSDRNELSRQANQGRGLGTACYNMPM